MAERNTAKKRASSQSDDTPGTLSESGSGAGSGSGSGPGTQKRPKRGRRANPVALDRIIHERVRLAIVSALAVNDSLTFTELKTVLETSDGNLSVHARRLEEVGYISCNKSFDGRVPRTEFRLTAAGRRALQNYLDHMEALIRNVRES